MTSPRLPPSLARALAQIAALGSSIRQRADLGDERRARLRTVTPWLWLALFSLAVSWAYTNPAPPRAAPAQPEAHGDGLYYYAYLRSLAFDHDVDFRNDYALTGDQFHAGINPITQRPQNVFTVGPALFWMPLVPVAHAAQRVSEWFGAPHEEVDGSEPSFQRVVLYGSTLAGLVATALILALALRITDRSLATLSAIGVCCGSPLIWFMVRQPSFSHATDACAVALFAFTWVYTFGSRHVGRWLGVGALLGLAMMVRPQNVANVLLPFAEWIWVFVELARARDRRALLSWIGTGGAFAVALMVAFSPLMFIWRSIYGTWTLVPQGADFMHWSDSRWDVTLFSSRGGLFAWHPLLLLGLSGLFVMALSKRYSRGLRLLGALAILILLTQSYINGAAKDWWGGWAFGGRRFLSCTFYLGTGVAVMLEGFRRAVVARPNLFVKLGVAAFLLMAALYNRSLSDDYLVGRVMPDAAQPMKPRYASALTKTLDEGYALIGNPGAWPANLLFAWRAHTSPERYDAAVAADIFEHPAGSGAWFDDMHAMGGFDAESTQWGGRTCRLAHENKLVWVFALRRKAALRGLVTVAPSEPKSRIRMKIGKRVLLDTELTPGWNDYVFHLPRSASHAGMFYVEVEQSLPSKGAFVAWEKAWFWIDPPRDDE